METTEETSLGLLTVLRFTTITENLPCFQQLPNIQTQKPLKGEKNNLNKFWLSVINVL